MIYKKVPFGMIGDEKIFLFKITNSAGNQVEITNFGGIVHAWWCKDQKGQLQDILLGCKNLSEYQKRHPYFGAIIGRYANRIAFGKFELDGTFYQLKTNLPPNHLHGGINGFDRKIWDPEVIIHDESCSVFLTTNSPHMDEGYPGNLEIKVVYTFTEDNELIMEYFCRADQSTHVNLTNHCYFNLSGDQESDILDHEVFIRSNQITEVDENLIPTGNILDVSQTPLDFSTKRNLDKKNFQKNHLLALTKGYDHNYILEKTETNEPAAQVIHPSSGRRLSIFTDQPGIQLYTGNWLNDVDGKSTKYKEYAGLCLETQHFPDSPNHPHFPSTLLQKEDTFYSKTTYKIDAIGAP